MNSAYDFDPEGVIRQKKFSMSDEEITGTFYENDDGRFIISFIKGMDVLEEFDVTNKWLKSKSVHEIDSLMNDFMSRIVTVDPW